MKQQKGISLIVVVITIIVMIIIAGAVILTLTDTNIINQAETATNKYNKQEYKMMLGTEYAILKTSEEGKGKPTEELFEMLKNKLQIENSNWTITSSLACIEINNEYTFTLLEDGTINDGKIVVLDIADGSIQLKKSGYIQGSNPLVEYDGDYIITGTTTENTVKVMEKGIYNITIKDLNIDVSNLSNEASPIDANAGNNAQGCYVNITLEGNNILYSNNMAGIHFCGGKSNTIVENERSILTIEGKGYLDAECKNGYCGAGIGGNYSANIPVCDIVINSGNIKAVGGQNKGDAIGGGLRQPVGNITINGGNIYAEANTYDGIHGKNVVINNGNVIVVSKKRWSY